MCASVAMPTLGFLFWSCFFVLIQFWEWSSACLTLDIFTSVQLPFCRAVWCMRSTRISQLSLAWDICPINAYDPRVSNPVDIACLILSALYSIGSFQLSLQNHNEGLGAFLFWPVFFRALSQKHKAVTFLKVAKEIFTGVHVVLVRLGYYEAHCHKVMHLAQSCNSETFSFYIDHLGIIFFNNMFSMIHREPYMYF